MKTNSKLDLFRGRVGVCNFWIGLILAMIICYPIGFIQNSTITTVLSVIIFPLVFIYYLSLIIKRLHDHNKSGWFGLAAYIPIYGLYVLFLIFYLPGNDDVNKYGIPKDKINIKNILGIVE